MNSHNGILRDERDSTLRLRAIPQKKKLTWVEYIPLIILIFVIVGLYFFTTGLLLKIIF